MNEEIRQELTEYLLSQGASDVGFFKYSEEKLPYGISVAVRLSEAIIWEIDSEPTHTYFNHYRSVNSLIDSLLLKAGLFLQKKGYKYITVAASQSINKDGWNYCARFSHKIGARLSGMGFIGKNALFIHKDYGSLVRLGTVFTDCELAGSENKIISSGCDGCNICAKVCPAAAINEKSFDENNPGEYLIDPKACSDYMKQNFQKIGRGSVCGLCIRYCPFNRL